MAMMRKLTDNIFKIYHYFLGILLLSYGITTHSAVDPSQLLPPEKAFIPSIEVADNQIRIDFKIADGYYLYQSKITATTNIPNLLKDNPIYSQGTEKHDEFFGSQIVYYHSGSITWQTNPTQSPYTITIKYQGCADVGVCYPPHETEFNISGNGRYQNTSAMQKVTDFLLKKPPRDIINPSSFFKNNQSNQQHFKLSIQTLGTNLLAFFIAGLALSFTACMYPLLPIVSSIIVGDKNSSKKRACLLSFIYVQGLALTYTTVGIIAGKTGALLTVWLQQAWVVLAASLMMVLLALSMFGLFSIQLPTSLQNFLQTQNNKLSGGKVASVFCMGMLSALIIGPCVAPPLAFALGYIGQTGDAILGGLALYTLAIGTGIPLIIIATFGGHVLPKAGSWMNSIKHIFGIILLAVAVYLATPFIGYHSAVTLYSLLLLSPCLYLVIHYKRFSGSLLRPFSAIIATLFAIISIWFASNSFLVGGTTPIHRFFTLHKPNQHKHTIQRFTDVQQLRLAIHQALQDNPSLPVLLDFYADWCITCKEMENKTFNHPKVQNNVPIERLIQIDVTDNTAEHQALLKEYGLFGPPGLFIIKADGSRSEALLGYMPADEFIEWYKNQNTTFIID